MFRAYLNPGEKILYVGHTHPITVYKPFIKRLFFGLAIPGLFYLMIPPFWMGWAIWGFAGLIMMFDLFLDWYFDALIITNQTLVDLEWQGIFRRSSTRIEYHTIEGVSYEVNGFWATILNYGDVTIERIGAGKIVGLKAVAFPKTCEREILDAQNEFMRNKSYRDHQTLRDMITSMMIDNQIK